jgi:hypothetical protein
MPLKTTIDPALSAYIDAAAALLSLPIGAEHRAAVEEQFARLAAMAALVAEHPLDIADDPAPVFHSGART